MGVTDLRSKIFGSHGSKKLMNFRIFTRRLSSSVLDKLINKLVASGLQPPGTAEFPLSEKELRKLCTAISEVLLSEPSLLELDPDITIVGDLHGQYTDLVQMLAQHGHPPYRRYLFLGDFVDRGPDGLNIVCLLWCLKLRYPDKLFMIRGNHECRTVNLLYGFYEECRQKLNVEVWMRVCNVFDTLPMAAVIAGKIFCVHGGLSFNLYKLKQIREIQRPLLLDETDMGLPTDLLWSDPLDGFEGWARNPRGSGYYFGADAVQEFKEDNNISMVVRSHQMAKDGYSFFGDKDLVTLFSAPNYRGAGNAAAMMCIDKDCHYSFVMVESESQEECGTNRPAIHINESSPNVAAVEKYAVSSC